MSGKLPRTAFDLHVVDGSNWPPLAGEQYSRARNCAPASGFDSV